MITIHEAELPRTINAIIVADKDGNLNAYYNPGFLEMPGLMRLIQVGDVNETSKRIRNGLQAVWEQTEAVDCQKDQRLV